ncbi:DUF4198 domain-containing protein [Ramlibacter tataouinensis]|uniref:DUF4198 domain-containing protein n=1 Tax=Ramlibacter tataouinensis (strain ATCC BAA-407 / DSM 14655 / LMG 21543 / TTB310) TaxID=365046 RepID=F5XZF6_RAMTT|nr:DUF4198 domain-containing protein [Ramlibacter tataouinensis]AEG94513.1 hypothetical protein Rta_34000 [Ramlibacter tataouinensis TTB310]
MAWQRWCAATLLALLATASWGHDSWLTPSRSVPPAGRQLLQLTTGNRYPVPEFSQSRESVVAARCSDGLVDLPLQPWRDQPQWLELAALAADGRPPLGCWLELAAVDVEIEPATVQLYFDEIRLAPQLRQAWAAQLARGVRWRERYRKFARVELPAAAQAAPERLRQARQPAGLGLELVVLGDQPVAARRRTEFQLLRDGKPLAGLPVELVSQRSAFGLWGRTDDQGRVGWVLPFGGQWLLRGTELLPSGERPDTWDSRFVTLVVEAS